MYTCIRSFTTNRGNYIPIGREVSWFFYFFLSDKNKKNFIPTEFYFSPEDIYRQEVQREDDDTIISPPVSMGPCFPEVVANDIEVPFGGGSGGGAGARGSWADKEIPSDWHPHEDFNPAGQAVVIDMAQRMFGQPDPAPNAYDEVPFVDSDSVQVPDPEVPSYPHMDPSDDRPMFPQDSDPVIGVQQDYSSPQQDSYDGVSDSTSDYSDSGSSDSSSSDY